MATRLYLSPVAPAPITTIAFDAAWSQNSGLRRGAISFRDDAPAQGNSLLNVVGPKRYAGWQSVSNPLQAQTIGGTVSGMLIGRYAGGSTNLAGQVYVALSIRVVAPNGTVRGTLLSYVHDDVALSASNTTQHRAHPAGAALTSVAAQAGDYLVIEVGTEVVADPDGNTALYSHLSTDATTDVSTDGDLVANTWVEFSQTLLFQPSALAAGTATLGAVASDSVSASATDATGGVGPYLYQWQRSLDAGASWQNLAGQDTLDLFDDTIQGPVDAKYRLEYSDQNQTIVHSNELTASVPGDPPTVQITSPACSQLTVPAGTPLSLSATAQDTVDGDVSASLAWSSSNPDDGTGGSLGTGASIAVDTTGYAAGRRTISATVTSTGGTTSASFTLNIGSLGFNAARFAIRAMGGMI